MIATQVQLTEEQDHLLDQLAQIQRVSKAELVQRAVDRFLHQEQPCLARRGPPTKEEWARARSVIGNASGDGANVSEEHDRYLAEAYAGWNRNAALVRSRSVR